MSDIYLSLTETPAVVTLSQPVVSGVLSSNVTVTNVVSVNVVTMPAITVQAAAPSVTTVAGTVAVSNFPASSSVTIANFPSVTTVTGTVALDSASLIALENVTVTVGAAVTIAGFSTSSLPPSTVTVANSVTISNFPSTQTIAGTVTANLPALNWNTVKITFGDGLFNGIYKKGSNGYVNAEGGGTPEYLPIDGFFQGGTIPKLTRGTYPGGPLSFTGTRWYFEANGDVQFYSATTNPDLRAIAEWTDSGGEADVQITPYSVEPVALPGGVEIAFSSLGQAPSVVTNSNPFPVKVQNSVTIGSLPAISGTVTAAAPHGSLTTRFGTPTTANTAFATSAVTNASRKYLLIQNVTTGSNVITVGIGFTPTTTQGIQLTAGAGITFESSYIPTGAVYVLSSVTASNFTILEA